VQQLQPKAKFLTASKCNELQFFHLVCTLVVERESRCVVQRLMYCRFHSYSQAVARSNGALFESMLIFRCAVSQQGYATPTLQCRLNVQRSDTCMKLVLHVLAYDMRTFCFVCCKSQRHKYEHRVCRAVSLLRTASHKES
jgi:hypothetical protein